MLPQSDQLAWRRVHIPHRVRAAIALRDMEQSILRVNTWIRPELSTPDHKVYWRCAADSIWEGRLAATRWLIAFIGISQKDGKPARPNNNRQATDVYIEHFDPGNTNLFDLLKPEAHLLAAVWTGCSQASSHATHNSNHPTVDDVVLSKALVVIVNHLQDTIYLKAGENIRDYVLEPVP